ncbi:MAG: helix-turn-helix domain-containing protein [Patescibacteria group bacterium]
MIKESLQKYGLSNKEADVYLALLELGKAKSREIATKTKLPRSTVYSVLEFLEKKGLVFSFDQGKIKTYVAQDPVRIVSDIASQAQAIKTIFPELKDLYQGAKTKPQIKYYQGVSELKGMYNGILKIKDLKSYDIVAAEGYWLKLDEKFLQDFKKRRAEAGIKTRLILDNSQASLERKANEEKTNSEVKIMPPSMAQFKISAGTYIFKDKVIFIAYKKELIAVEIISEEISSLLKMMFEFCWQFLAK